MTWPKPEPGLVIRYSYLWKREAEAGREEGTKDRPCAIIITLLRQHESPLVRVLPITHSQPADRDGALEIPQETKLRLGLDSARSWIILDEANDFVWPGPDLRPSVNGQLATAAIGKLPPGLLSVLREKFKTRYLQGRTKATKRTE